MYRNHRIITVAPCLNEELKITDVVRRIQKSKFADEVVVVDDGSTDNSVSRCKELGATVIELGKTIGVGAALRAGFDYAKSRADIIVVLAGNNKDEPNEISRLVDPIVDGKADFVQGSRFLKGGGYGGDMPLYRKIATRVHPILFSIATGKWTSESTNGFRAFRISLLDDPKIFLTQKWLDGYELEPYLYYKAVNLGYRCVEVPVTKIYPAKKLGITKMRPVTDWWAVISPLILLRLGIRK